MLSVAVRTAIGLHVAGAAKRAAPALRLRHQMAIRTRSACERVAAAVQAAHDAGNAVALLDRANAYGAVARGSLLPAVSALLPDSILIFSFLYGGPIPLTGHVPPGASATTGVLQGDPLAPLVFAALLHTRPSG